MHSTANYLRRYTAVSHIPFDIDHSIDNTIPFHGAHWPSLALEP